MLARSVLPILHSLVDDPIPNIRFNVAKSYAVLIDIFKRIPDSQTATVLQLEKDGGKSNIDEPLLILCGREHRC